MMEQVGEIGCKERKKGWASFKVLESRVSNPEDGKERKWKWEGRG
jgi:hypothetical protein